MIFLTHSEWCKHLVPGKLYRHIHPDLRAWNDAHVGPIMMFVMFLEPTQKHMKFLAGDGELEIFPNNGQYHAKNWARYFGSKETHEHV